MSDSFVEKAELIQKLLEKHGLKIVKKRFNLKPGLRVIVMHADAGSTNN